MRRGLPDKVEPVEEDEDEEFRAIRKTLGLTQAALAAERGNKAQRSEPPKQKTRLLRRHEQPCRAVAHVGHRRRRRYR